MRNDKRVVKFYKETDLLETLGLVSFERIPNVHEHVDKMDIVCLKELKDKYKATIKSALKKINNFLVQTHYWKARDFRKLCRNFFEPMPSNGQFNRLKFTTTTKNKENNGGYYDALNNDIVIAEKLLFECTEKQLESLLVHELLHFYTLALNVEYVNNKNERVFMPSFVKASDYKNTENKVIIDKSGKTREEDFDKTLYLGSFFIEGYTELMTQVIMGEKFSRNYKEHVSMVELMMYATDKKYDFTDFLRCDMGHVKNELGFKDFSKLISSCEYYQDYVYSSENRSHNTPDEYLLKAQSILINHKLEKIKNKYRNTNEIDSFTYEFMELMEYIPNIQDDIIDLYMDSKIELFGENFNDDIISELLSETLISKSNSLGKQIQKNIDGLEIGIERIDEESFFLFINGHYCRIDEIDEESVFYNFSDKDSKPLFVKEENGLTTINYIDSENNKKAIQMQHFYKDNSKKYIFTFEGDKGLEKLSFEEKSTDYIKYTKQNLNFIKNQELIKGISSKLTSGECKNILEIEIPAKYRKQARKNLYAVETLDGETHFFEYDEKNRVNQVYIENVEDRPSKLPMFERVEIGDKYFNRNIHQYIHDGTVICLEDGTLLSATVNEYGQLSYSIIYENYALDTINRKLYDSRNKTLKNTWQKMEYMVYNESER